mgnify:FL=1
MKRWQRVEKYHFHDETVKELYRDARDFIRKILLFDQSAPDGPSFPHPHRNVWTR